MNVQFRTLQKAYIYDYVHTRQLQLRSRTRPYRLGYQRGCVQAGSQGNDQCGVQNMEHPRSRGNCLAPQESAIHRNS